MQHNPWDPCIVYLPTFIIKKYPNVGRYTIPMEPSWVIITGQVPGQFFGCLMKTCWWSFFKSGMCWGKLTGLSCNFPTDKFIDPRDPIAHRTSVNEQGVSFITETKRKVFRFHAPILRFGDAGEPGSLGWRKTEQIQHIYSARLCYCECGKL